MSNPAAELSVQYLKGIGPRRARALARAGLRTARDLLYLFPTRYEEFAGLVDIENLVEGQHVTVRGAVTRVRGRHPHFSAQITDSTGVCWLRWFNQKHGGRGLFVGATVIATGQVKAYDSRAEIVHPRIKVYPPDAMPEPADNGPELRPVYPSIPDVEPAIVQQAIDQVLARDDLISTDPLPSGVRIQRSLPPRRDALRAIHHPPTHAAVTTARQRFAYEELLLLELAVMLRRRRLARQTAVSIPIPTAVDQRIRARLPFQLTGAQDRCIADVAGDLKGERPMTRLLQGDVGSGKTVVALYGCLAAVAAGRQAAFIAPTEILARQHFYKIKQYLHASRVRLALLTGSLPATERNQTRAALADGAIDIVVGTHALLRHDTQFARLAFVVIDEQHRFGVHQRVLARGQRGLPHLLVMSATPIPRTLALTFFGHLDVSVLDESPPGRGRVHTDIVKPDNWPALLDRLRPKLAAGERAYIVCPRIGQRPSTSPLRGAQQVYEELTQKHWRDLNVGLVHGQQAADENAATLQAFADGKLHALVATSMIEVGVDVPAATTMIIEHAERFGLAQLHQLRGRIGRGERDSHCYLVARADADAAQTRLTKLCETTDGFAIAEADLALRGPGEVLGARQHGLPELRFADLSQDLPLLRQARADAAEIVRDDPGLTQPAHQHLRGWLKRRFRGRFELIDAA